MFTQRFDTYACEGDSITCKVANDLLGEAVEASKAALERVNA